jgi:hypothetical protein
MKIVTKASIFGMADDLDFSNWLCNAINKSPNRGTA